MPLLVYNSSFNHTYSSNTATSIFELGNTCTDSGNNNSYTTYKVLLISYVI